MKAVKFIELVYEWAERRQNLLYKLADCSMHLQHQRDDRDSTLYKAYTYVVFH